MRRLFAPSLILTLLVGAPALAQQSSSTPPDIAAIRAAIPGTWQSTDDTKFTREFDSDGRSADRYEGDASATTEGRWAVFLGTAAPPSLAGRKLQANAVYLKLDENGDQLLFALIGLSRSELKMVYLERGNILSFSRLK